MTVCDVCGKETDTLFWLPSHVGKLKVEKAVCRHCFVTEVSRMTERDCGTCWDPLAPDEDEDEDEEDDE